MAERRGLVRDEPPLGQGGQLDAEERVGVLDRLLDVARHALVEHRPAALPDFLIGELARAVGLGGRDRRAGVASERARAAVTQALRKAVGRLRDACPPLGDHLDRTVRTETYCACLPDPRFPSTWST